MDLRYAQEDLDRFGVAEVLAAHGLPAPARGPCPLCLTSNASQAFTVRGIFWHCFACGAKGNPVQLYAALSGVTAGAAIRAIAGHLGLDPVDDAALGAAREATMAARMKADQAERIARARWQGAFARRDVTQGAIDSIRVCTPASWDVLRNLYASLGDVECWIEQAEYPAKDWA